MCADPLRSICARSMSQNPLRSMFQSCLRILCNIHFSGYMFHHSRATATGSGLQDFSRDLSIRSIQDVSGSITRSMSPDPCLNIHMSGSAARSVSSAFLRLHFILHPPWNLVLKIGYPWLGFFSDYSFLFFITLSGTLGVPFYGFSIASMCFHLKKNKIL